jgi:hypothetical protein
MFDHTSRYYSIETATITLPDGRTVSYTRRRFLPEGDEMPLLLEVASAQGERPDQLAARTLSDPLQYWRLCDANNVMNPLELTPEQGRSLRVPLPQP